MDGYVLFTERNIRMMNKYKSGKRYYVSSGKKFGSLTKSLQTELAWTMVVSNEKKVAITMPLSPEGNAIIEKFLSEPERKCR